MGSFGSNVKFKHFECLVFPIPILWWGPCLNFSDIFSLKCESFPMRPPCFQYSKENSLFRKFNRYFGNIYRQICYVYRKAVNSTEISVEFRKNFAVTIITYGLSKCNTFLLFLSSLFHFFSVNRILRFNIFE